MNRREFFQRAGAAALLSRAGTAAGTPDAEILARIEAARPSKTDGVPQDFRDRLGAAHVAGKYHLTSAPFLLEGAKRLLEFGMRVGKFWFTPAGIEKSYPFNSRWPKCHHFLDLARTEYFEALFDLPFATVILEAHTPIEEGWRRSGLEPSFYEAVEAEFFSLADFLLRRYRERRITVILQHWEGDWLLRGRGGELWRPAPSDWKERCERMQLWLAARQRGVTRARQAHPAAQCQVLHASEVNRVADAWENVPTVTRDVLPFIELDMVSYSCYDALGDPGTLWRALAEIRKSARFTGAADGDVFVGEIGLPENERAAGAIEDLWDRWLGVLIAADVPYIVQWELYCNEWRPKVPAPPELSVAREDQLRGFWLVKPDGTLGVTGALFKKWLSR